ncbi:MAG: Gfo/Idh/MocA family oxidoreductase [Chloroflexota bacterium]
MKQPYRVAIAGCHRMLLHRLTNHNFAAAFHAVPETEMVAVFDLGPETRSEFLTYWGEMPTYDNYAQMLAETQPDILCLATRQTMHADQIELAAEAGVRGILCDKPLATSMNETDRIINACQTHNVALLFGLDRRHLRPYQTLRQQLTDGLVGEVQSVMVHGLPNLINHGCHSYDTTLMLLNDPEPIWVSGFVDDVSAEPPDSRVHLDPAGRGQIGLDNGVTVYITPDGGRKPSFQILGDKGRLLIFNDANEAYLWSTPADTPADTNTGTQTAGLQPLDLPPHEDNWPAGPAMVRDLIRAIETGTPTVCDIDQARRATEIGFGFHLSHQQNGARVLLPATTRDLSIPSFPWGNEKE